MIKRSTGEVIFQVVNVTIMLMIMASIILPLMSIFSLSVSDRIAVSTMKVGLLPVGFNLGAYTKILSNALFQRSLINTVGITVFGTAISIIVITMMAYAMSKQYFFGKKFITYFMIITMYFSGGLIPSYLLMTKYLKLGNTYLAYILPALVNVFYVIVIRSQIEAVPGELFDSGSIDGAGEMRILFNIVLPVIAPTIAAISMFLALGKWNMWFSVLLYATDKKMWSLQFYLREVVFASFLESTTLTTGTSIDAEVIPSENMRMASIILVALPIVAIYPFIQKYFVKGIMAGSVKG
jgi:putative aldouronate transport system permease protein